MGVPDGNKGLGYESTRTSPPTHSFAKYNMPKGQKISLPLYESFFRARTVLIFNIGPTFLSSSGYTTGQYVSKLLCFGGSTTNQTGINEPAIETVIHVQCSSFMFLKQGAT